MTYRDPHRWRSDGEAHPAACNCADCVARRKRPSAGTKDKRGRTRVRADRYNPRAAGPGGGKKRKSKRSPALNAGDALNEALEILNLPTDVPPKDEKSD